MICVTGSTGTGKSFFSVWLLLRVILAGDRWVTAVFPHRPPGLFLIAALYDLFGDGLWEFLQVDDLDQVKKVVMDSFVLSSADPDPWERKRQNDEFLWSHQTRLIMRRKDITDISDRPNLEQYSATVIRAGQHQDRWYPESELPKALRPYSKAWRYFVHHCTEPAARDDLLRIVDVPPRDGPTTLFAAERLLNGVHGNVMLAARTCKPVRWNRAAFLADGHTNLRPGVRVILGGGTSPDALRTYVGCDLHATGELARKRLLGPGLYAIDEVQNYKLGGEPLAQAAATLRFTGMDLLVIQHCFDWETEAGRKLNQMCEHYIFRLHDPDNADYAAKIVRGSYDPMKIHHVERTTRQRTHHTTQKRVTKGKSIGPDGERKTESETDVLVPEIEEYVEETPDYEKGIEQQFWRAGEFQEMADRVCWVKRAGGPPFLFPVPEVKDGWACDGESASEEVGEQCIRELMDRVPLYEAPVTPELPDEPMPPDAVRPPKAPKPPKPPAKKPNKLSTKAARSFGKPGGKP